MVFSCADATLLGDMGIVMDGKRRGTVVEREGVWYVQDYQYGTLAKIPAEERTYEALSVSHATEWARVAYDADNTDPKNPIARNVMRKDVEIGHTTRGGPGPGESSTFWR